jgi:hypothetical protein
LFRLVTDEALNAPTKAVTSNFALGKAARGPEKLMDFVHKGISTWDSLAGALSKVEVIEQGGKVQVVGVAMLRIPAGAEVAVTQTFSAGHYTVNASAELLASFWEDSVWLLWK